MKKLIGISTLIIIVAMPLIWLFAQNTVNKPVQITGAPPYGEDETEVPTLDPYAWLRNWVRPEVPTKVALQVGHLESGQFPEELAVLRKNTGAQAAGITEVEVNMTIAEETAKLLRKQGIEVEILPATIPPKYWADAFIAIHADGNLNTTINGYKIAPPWRDWTGKANKLSNLLEKTYGENTGLILDPNITRNMRGYYAFSWWRYEHAIHPMTPGVIVETGFLTNWNDRQIIVRRPEIAAKGIADGIMEFLRSENLL